MEYPTGVPVRRVRSTGKSNWRGRLVCVRDALIGEPGGLREIENALWRIECGPRPVALDHPATQQFVRLEEVCAYPRGVSQRGTHVSGLTCYRCSRLHKLS